MVRNCLKTLDSGFCRNDGKWYFLTFYEIINLEKWRKRDMSYLELNGLSNNSKEVFMQKFKKILVPVSLSKESPEVVPYVRNIAEMCDAEIHLLFVARNLDSISSFYVPERSMKQFEDESVQGAQKRLNEFAEDFFKDYPVCKTRVVVGDTVKQIVKCINSEDFDLVIVGSRGRKDINRLIFGSVAKEVIDMSSAPVLTVNADRISVN
jgi:nucleotide-binding universal stress UspA family protein